MMPGLPETLLAEGKFNKVLKIIFTFSIIKIASVSGIHISLMVLVLMSLTSYYLYEYQHDHWHKNQVPILVGANSGEGVLNSGRYILR